MALKVDDLVRVGGTPDSLDAETALVFKKCLGGVFRIAGFERALVELEVGEAFGQALVMHSIWIEPHLVTKFDDQSQTDALG